MVNRVLKETGKKRLTRFWVSLFDGLPENIGRICYADQWAIYIEYSTWFAIAIVTERNDIPLVGGVVNQLYMCSVGCLCRKVRTVYPMAKPCRLASCIFPISNPVPWSAPFSQIEYFVQHTKSFDFTPVPWQFSEVFNEGCLRCSKTFSPNSLWQYVCQFVNFEEKSQKQLKDYSFFLINAWK